MPVGAVGGGAGSLVGHCAYKWAGACAGPETDGAAGELGLFLVGGVRRVVENLR